MKFKITVLDQSTGRPKAEIVEQEYSPQFSQFYSLASGGYGVMVKIELLMEADDINTTDTTQQ